MSHGVRNIFTWAPWININIVIIIIIIKMISSQVSIIDVTLNEQLGSTVKLALN